MIPYTYSYTPKRRRPRKNGDGIAILRAVPTNLSMT